MRLKSELYKKEQNEILEKIIIIMNLDDENSITLRMNIDIVKIEDEKKLKVKNMEKYYWNKRKLKLEIKQ